MLTLLYVLLGLVLVGALIIIVYAKTKATDNSQIVVSEKTPLCLESLTDEEAIFSVQMPLRNTGKEDGVMLDVFARAFLPQEQFSEAVCFTHVETVDRRRNDNYFEAMILPSGAETMLVVTLRYVAQNKKKMRDIMENMVDMDVAMYLNGAGRRDTYVKKAFFTIFATDIKTLVRGAKDHD